MTIPTTVRKFLFLNLECLDKYIVCGRMESNSFNVNGSTAFQMLLDSNYAMQQIVIYKGLDTDEKTIAMAWDQYSYDTAIYGVVFTNQSHYMFSQSISSSSTLPSISWYKNSLNDTSLIGFFVPNSYSDFYVYTSFMTNGERGVHVDWRSDTYADGYYATLYNPGFNTYISRNQISYSNAVWTAYIFHDLSNTCKLFKKSNYIIANTIAGFYR